VTDPQLWALTFGVLAQYVMLYVLVQSITSRLDRIADEITRQSGKRKEEKE
jgi:hypothetical protein